MEPRSSSPRANADATATFREPVNDAANGIYRRRSPLGECSDDDGSPIHKRNYSPIRLRKDREKGADDRRKKDDGREIDRDSGRSHYVQNGESYRNSDHRQFSRSSRNHHRHGDYHRRDKYVGDDDRDYSRSRSGRDPRTDTYSDHSRRESEYRTRDHPIDDDKYSRDKFEGLSDRIRYKEREKDSASEDQKYTGKDLSSHKAGSGRRHTEDVKYGERDRYKEDKVGFDEKIDHRRSSGDYRRDRSSAYEGSRGHRNDSTSTWDRSGHHLREASESDSKSFAGENYTREQKKNSDDRDRYKEHHPIEPGKLSEVGNDHVSKDPESPSKKPKLFGFNGSNSNASGTDRKQSLSSSPALEVSGEGSAEQACLTDSDIDAAKVAAMKAAELVNRNLIGTGFMSADRKKKLLWGNKKNTAEEESDNRWDTTIFGDPERQEKFHKLMGVKGEMKAEPKPHNEDVEKKREQLQLDLEKQYTAGLRRRDGRTVGLGL